VISSVKEIDPVNDLDMVTDRDNDAVSDTDRDSVKLVDCVLEKDSDSDGVRDKLSLCVVDRLIEGVNDTDAVRVELLVSDDETEVVFDELRDGLSLGDTDFVPSWLGVAVGGSVRVTDDRTLSTQT